MDAAQIRRKNINALADKYGREVLATKIGYKDTIYLNQLCGGHGSFGARTARKIEKALGLEHGWMDQDHSGHTHNVSPGPAIKGEVPLISWVQAGAWQEIVDHFQPGDAEEWRPTTANCGPNAFALRVTGDSMLNPYSAPSIPEGSVVIVDPDVSADNGKIVVAKLEDSQEATLKRLIIDGPNKYLKALNPEYKAIEINGNCRIVGVVRQIITDL